VRQSEVWFETQAGAGTDKRQYLQHEEDWLVDCEDLIPVTRMGIPKRI
jgi:hypothetical protein